MQQNLYQKVKELIGKTEDQNALAVAIATDETVDNSLRITAADWVETDGGDADRTVSAALEQIASNPNTSPEDQARAIAVITDRNWWRSNEMPR